MPTRPPQVTELIRSFGALRALVIGDVMLDEYLYGSVERISPEAPVPVVSLARRALRPGGAANVALNALALGAEVDLIGLRGDDEPGQALEAALAEHGLPLAGLITSDTRRTTRKARVLSAGQQLLRVDTEDTHPASDEEVARLAEAFDRCFAESAPDVVICEDYDKGSLSAELIEHVLSRAGAAGVPVAVDPKATNFWRYRGVALFKPNRKELLDALPELEPERTTGLNLDAAHHRLRQTLGHGRSLITLGSQGAYLNGGEGPGLRVAAHPREVADVCGAGDSVIAAASLALAAGAKDADLLALANLAGGLACEHVGVRPVTAPQLLAATALTSP